MAKLTKSERREHAKAEELLSKDHLTWEDKEFVYRNWHEGATNNNGAAGAFFTPFDMAFDFALHVGGGRVIDLCAGIGALTFAVQTRHRYRYDDASEFVCIERNPEYVEVGKKLVPEATWICADVFDVLDMNLDKFDEAMSNPPFGNVKRIKNSPRYTGKDFEFHVIDIASHLATYGTFIVPQNSAGFHYSGRPYYERQTSGKAFDFQEKTGMFFECGVGVDTSFYLKDWKGVSPLTEIVSVEFD